MLIIAIKTRRYKVGYPFKSDRPDHNPLKYKCISRGFLIHGCATAVTNISLTPDDRQCKCCP
jgi:hypothetical protein